MSTTSAAHLTPPSLPLPRGGHRRWGFEVAFIEETGIRLKPITYPLAQSPTPLVLDTIGRFSLFERAIAW